MLLDLVEKAIQRDRLISVGDRGLVAFSGGPDSLCLLHLLSRLSSKLSLELRAAHVDHGLRPESADEARRAVHLATSLDIPTEILCAGLERCDRGNLQDRARRARLELLHAEANRQGCRWVALAHTAQDQAETVLMRAIRGAGTRGLSCMAPRRGLFVRPLLDVTRPQVERYLELHALSPIQDPTNQMDHYLRNRIRHGIMPLLEKENPAVVKALCRLATICREEDEALQKAAQEALEKARTEEGFDIRSWKDLPKGLLHRTLRMVFAEATGGMERLTRQHVEELAHLIRSEAGTRRQHLPGTQLERRYHQILWSRSRLSEGFTEIIVSGLGEHRLSDGRTLRVSTGSKGTGSNLSLAADRIAFPLIIRPPRPGDRLSIGPDRTKKISRVLQDAKIPRSKRGRILVVLSEGKVVLLVGLRRGFGFAPRDQEERLWVHILEEESGHGVGAPSSG